MSIADDGYTEAQETAAIARLIKPWRDALPENSRVTIGQVMTHAIGITDAGDLENRGAQFAIGRALKKLGWKRYGRSPSLRTRLYHKSRLAAAKRKAAALQ